MARRPGITFETVTPSRPDTLPRMDVAAFVGFATRGPIDVPVPVEDLERFRDIFGPPLTLVRDRDAERVQTAHLHRTVEAFFRNGGRRCWVVRVAQAADEASPSGPVERATFGLPGLVSAETGRPTTVQARCYGATFNTLRVGTVLRRRVLPRPSTVEPVSRVGDGNLLAQAEGNGLRLAWSADRRDPLAETDLVRGDLLRLSVTGGLVAVAPVTTPPSSPSPNGTASQGGSPVTLKTAPASLFVEVPDRLAAPGADVGPVEVTIPARTPSGTDTSFPSTSARTFAVRRMGSDDPPQFELAITETSAASGDEAEAAVAALAGRMVHLDEQGGPLTGWAKLGDVQRRPEEDSKETVLLEVRDARWPVSASEVDETGLPDVESVQRLRFDLLAWSDRELHARLDALGVASAHPRAWTALPVDEDLFALQDGESVTPPPGSLRADASDPRFPLAGPEAPGAGPFVPLGMPERPDPDRTLGRLAPTTAQSRLEQERLRTFSPDLFLDTDLAEAHTARLGEKADRKFYLEEDSSEGASTGLHTLWPVDEPTLLAVPDAVHRGWDEPRSIPPSPASTPFLPAPTVDRDADPPVIRLSWTGNRFEQGVALEAGDEIFEADVAAPVDPSPGGDEAISVSLSTSGTRPAARLRLSWTVGRLGDGVEVEVQEATTPTFEDPVTRYRGAEPSVDRYVRADAPQTLFFRYRVVTEGRAGAWSNARRVDVPAPDFEACRARLQMPELAVYHVGGEPRRAWVRWPTWRDPPGPEVEFDVQVDQTATFASPEDPVGEDEPIPVASHPPGTSLPQGDTDYYWWEIPLRDAPAVQYVRVRARRSGGSETAVSPWSNTVAVTHRLQEEMPVVPIDEYEGTTDGGREGLLDVHTAMLRFGAARGDLLSVLSLPGHDQPADARRHVTRLQTPGAQLDADEERTLSYGAVYYPWLLHPTGEGAQLVPTPPDGAACGLLARQAVREGAWTSAANTPLAAVRTVVPPLDPDERAALEGDAINAFGEQPAGILTLGTATLARDPDLEPIPTRRLLILVRRLVRREGPELVFENNTPRLRQRIAEQFDAVLRRLFRRGAFAGRTPAEGYRVVADETVNPPGQRERERLAVELRIAPAEPLTFVTVRLVQRGGAPTVTEAPAGVTV